MADGEASFDLAVRPEHMNPYGVLHGGVVYTLVDYAMGAALGTRLSPGERCATLEVKIQYLAPVSGGEVRAEARVVDRTRRIGVLEARAYADGARLVALATGTFYIHSPA
jgi:acyl-CoA thioesterase